MTSPSRGTRGGSERRAGLARLGGLGAIFLSLFGALDALLVATVHREVGFAVPLSIRALASGVGVVAWWVAWDPRFGDRAAEASHAALVAAAAAMIAVLSAMLEGPGGPYLHGLSIAFILRATVIPGPFRESMGWAALLFGSHFVALALVFAIDPAAHAGWLEPAELVRFAASYLLVVGVTFGGALGSSATYSARTQLHEARRLGRYRLEAPIGRGGQNEVWLAWDGSLERQVALKILDGGVASPEARELFEREAKLASQLSSPHAVRVYDFGASDDGIGYLAMEYLPGADLATVVGSHGALAPARVVHFGIQACRALEEAHALGLVHRDVKPANLRVTKVGDSWDFLKLVDFGIARRRTHDPDHSTVTGKLRGTPAYMAPEACRGEASAESIDIYGLGATLYHLLAGQPPFTGDDVEIVSAQLTAKASPPSVKRGAQLPEDLERIVLRCLEKEPGDRYPSALALREALEECADAGRWSASDAAAFWEGDRPAALERWGAETLA